MLIAILNNLTELITGLAWSGLVAFAAFRLGRWWERRRRQTEPE